MSDGERIHSAERLAMAEARVEIEKVLLRASLTVSETVALLAEMAHRKALANVRPPKGGS